MYKRGQVTIFVVIGIVVLLLVILLVAFRDTLLETKFGSQTNEDLVTTQVESIREHVESCIEEKGSEVISVLGKQGGSMNPGLSKYWYGDDISYLCYTEQYTACFNTVPFLIDHMEDEINEYVQTGLSECVDFGSWESRGYEIESGSYTVDTTIGDENIIILVDYPITITRGDAVLEENRFSKNFEIPLGKLARVAKRIVNDEIHRPLGIVNVMQIIADFNGDVNIVGPEAHNDDEVYVLSLREDLLDVAGEPYKFQFAVRGWAY